MVEPSIAEECVIIGIQVKLVIVHLAVYAKVAVSPCYSFDYAYKVTAVRDWLFKQKNLMR